MKRSVALACIALAAGFGPSACSIGRSPAIPRAELAQRIEAGTAPFILDVRSTSEYEAGHVPGALHIPFADVDERHAEMGLAMDEPIVVYCAHGPRAAWAARSLHDAGYTDVVYLEGHMTSWEADGLPVEAMPTEQPVD